MIDEEVKQIFINAEYNGNIYLYNSAVETKFSDEMQDGLFRLEDNSWWFKYRAAVIHNIFKKHMNKDQAVIDIGGGNGFTKILAG